MTRAKILLAGLAVAATSFAAMPTHAAGPCYNLRIISKGRVLINQWIGLCPKTAEVVSQTTQHVGATTIQTTRYAAA